MYAELYFAKMTLNRFAANIDPSGLNSPGARFSNVPVTFRTRNQIFKSKYKEQERGSWQANYSILIHVLIVLSC